MGKLREWLGVGKPVMGYGLGIFHLFLSLTFFGFGGGSAQRYTALLLVFVGTGMIVWGEYNRKGTPLARD